MPYFANKYDCLLYVKDIIEGVVIIYNWLFICKCFDKHACIPSN